MARWLQATEIESNVLKTNQNYWKTIWQIIVMEKLGSQDLGSLGWSVEAT